jgi:hypothetical protein
MQNVAGPIRVERFNTESGHDKLTVNGVHYTSTAGPHGVTPTGTILWTTDHSVVKSGWKLCRGTSLDSQHWNASGGCEVLGQCVQSPNYPAEYTNSDSCSITQKNAGPITVTSFNTEASHDKLTLNGVEYHGTTAPHNGTTPTGSIRWVTDGSVVKSGWKLCQTWVVVSGNCTVSGQCIQSPNYPGMYANSDGCLISAQTGPLSVLSFNTESGHDKLTVNGVDYHNTAGPNGIVPSGLIQWTTDGSVVKNGWKICAQSTE